MNKHNFSPEEDKTLIKITDEMSKAGKLNWAKIHVEYNSKHS